MKWNTRYTTLCIFYLNAPHCAVFFKMPHIVLSSLNAPHCAIFFKTAPHCAIRNQNAPHCAIFLNAQHCAIFYLNAPHFPQLALVCELVLRDCPLKPRSHQETPHPMQDWYSKYIFHLKYLTYFLSWKCSCLMAEVWLKPRSKQVLYCLGLIWSTGT